MRQPAYRHERCKEAEYRYKEARRINPKYAACEMGKTYLTPSDNSQKAFEMNMNDIVGILKESEAVHSMLLFGSSARGEATSDSDIDICIIENPGVTLDLKEKLRITRELPEKVDISFFRDLPLSMRQSVLQEGEILYTRDDYYVYTLVKEIDYEMPQYERMQEEYHREVMKRVKKRLALLR